MKNIKDELIKKYTPTVKFIAQRIAARLPASVELDDLVSAGVIGLMDAIEKYDPSRENTFKTYAEFRIRGAVLDELRSQDWVPRSVRDKAKILDHTIKHLTEATNEEAAAAMGVSLDDYYRLVNLVKPVSLVSLDDEYAPQLPCTDKEFGAKEARRDLRRLTSDCNLQQKMMLKLYHIWGLKCIEIAELFEVTESRVSQIISITEAKMKRKIEVDFKFGKRQIDFDEGA